MRKLAYFLIVSLEFLNLMLYYYDKGYKDGYYIGKSEIYLGIRNCTYE